MKNNDNGSKIKGVIATGSMARHADTFCFAGDLIAEEYQVPCLGKIDGAGDEDAVKKLKADLGL